MAALCFHQEGRRLPWWKSFWLLRPAFFLEGSLDDVRPWSVCRLGQGTQCFAWPFGNRAAGRAGNRLFSGTGHRGGLSLAKEAKGIKKASSRSLATGTVLYFWCLAEVRRCRWQRGLGAAMASSPFIYVFIIVGHWLPIKQRGPAENY